MRAFKYFVIGIFFILTHLVNGCLNLRQEAREEYESDPVIGVQYNAEQDITIFDTRTINLDVRDCNGKRCVLNCSASVICEGQPSSVHTPRTQQLIFRSLSPEPRFLTERELTLTIDGHLYNMGLCTHDGMKNTERGVLEDLSIHIEKEIMLALAKADIVRGALGTFHFEVVKEALTPVQRLVEAAVCLTK